MAQPVIIAEVASAHDGDLKKALALVGIAKQSEADYYKIQYWSSAQRLAERRHAEKYLRFYERHQVPRDWLPILARAAQAHGLGFMCTAFLPEDIAVVAPHVDVFKVASFEATDYEFIRAHGCWYPPKSVWVSTGMMTAQEIEAMFTRAGPPWPAALLHCVSGYPTPISEANLGVIRWLRNLADPPGDFGPSGPDFLVGFSDHTANEHTGAWAVCAGAQILEVHVCLEETDRDNPDRAYALLPGQLAHYIELARLAAKAMGDGIKRPMPVEAEMAKYRVGGP